MSEPVGNASRGADLTNSHKSREVIKSKQQAEDAPPKMEKVISGKVVTRKAPWYKRAASSMIADDAQSIGDFILVDVLVPAMKNLIMDIVSGGTNRALYGSRGRARGVGISGGARERDDARYRTRYDRMGEGEPRRMLSREDRATHNFDDIFLTDRQEAIDVVNALIMRVEEFGSASVSDLYDALGTSGSYADLRHGWTNLMSADVRQSRGGWQLVLPAPKPLPR